MDSSATIFWGILISVILGSAATNDVNSPDSNTSIPEFIETSCRLTQYPKLCISSLSPYAGSLKPAMSEIAKAAVTVSLVNARNFSVWVAGLKTLRADMSEIEKAALKNCIQNIQDTRDSLRESLTAMKHLRRITFDSQMDDVLSGMNAVFTNEDDCVNGLDYVDGEVRAMVTERVQDLHRLITTALDLVNALAATGIRGNEIDE